MSIASDFHLFCCICARAFTANAMLNHAGGRGFAKEAVCSPICLDEKNWRMTLSTMGREYYPRQSKGDDA